MKPITWLAQEFKEIDLGDKRLTERCDRVVKTLGKEPKKSIPSACGDWVRPKGFTGSSPTRR